MCHAQQDAASHQPRQDIELSSCVKAPTNRAAPRNLYLALQSIGLRLTVLLRKVRYRSRRLASRGTRSAGGHPFFAVDGASPRQRDHALQSTIPPVLSFVKDGRLRGIATTGLARSGAAGAADYRRGRVAGFDVPLWFGLAAPKGTPRPIVEKLAAALDKTLAMPDVQEALMKQGFTAMNLGPEEFGKFYAAEAAKWAKVVDAVGLGR